MKKYELTDDTVQFLCKTLHRIKALRDFGDVKAGDLGGYIETESNLSHDGDAWVSGDAEVYGEAEVFGNARVFGEAEVFGNARVSDNAWVYGDAEVYGDARVFGEAEVFGNARVSDNAWVSGNARVLDNAWVLGDARVSGDAWVSGDARVREPSDIALIKGFGSEFRATSFFRCVDGLVRCQCGCFYGTVDEFRSKVRETHGDSKYAKEYTMIADLMELHFKED